MSDMERLRAVAEAAKADSDGVGDWSRGPADCYGNTPTVQMVIPPDPEPFTVAAGCSDANAEHIATFDPTTVLALLDRLAAADALADEFAYRAAVHEAHPEHDTDRYLDGFSSAMRVAEKVARTALAPAESHAGHVLEREFDAEDLKARMKAVLAACDLAENEARHVVDDEVYVSVGLIRNALNGIACEEGSR